jgi:hypothetical protein
MGPLLGIIGLIVGLGSAACWIYTIVRLFQIGKTIEGVCAICPLVGFILGWVRVKELNHQKVMVIWSVLLVVSILINVMLAGSGIAGTR